jgi:hypothetical protein
MHGHSHRHPANHLHNAAALIGYLPRVDHPGHPNDAVVRLHRRLDPVHGQLGQEQLDGVLLADELGKALYAPGVGGVERLRLDGLAQHVEPAQRLRPAVPAFAQALRAQPSAGGLPAATRRSNVGNSRPRRKRSIGCPWQARRGHGCGRCACLHRPQRGWEAAAWRSTRLTPPKPRAWRRDPRPSRRRHPGLQAMPPTGRRSGSRGAGQTAGPGAPGHSAGPGGLGSSGSGSHPPSMPRRSPWHRW